MNVYEEVLQAEQRIRSFVRETPLDYSLALSQQYSAEVFLKLENLQHTGSFKVRGALNKLLSLTPEEQARGVVTASTGNHGAATAFGLRALHLAGTIFVPENAATTKVAAIQRYGARIETHGADCLETEMYAQHYARQHGLMYISPYNDPQVVGGQGTIGIELTRQAEKIDAVFIAVGGGGLISGIAGYLKHVLPGVQVIGCLPENSPEMALAVKAGHHVQIEPQPTLSDGTAGGFEPGAITFELCQQLVDEYVLVSEAEIAAALRLVLETHHQLIEGSAGVAIAGFQKLHQQYKGKNVVIVLCGANISLATLKQIL
ncbi:MAG TPA: threonine/serine dehydratase [Blastocatellia bacterium]|nr:threonine/serine dehydratase [Blastocatellia bacterium]